jgi:hypothetical protein
MGMLLWKIDAGTVQVSHMGRSSAFFDVADGKFPWAEFAVSALDLPLVGSFMDSSVS